MKEFAKEVQLQRESLSYKQMKIDDDTVSEDIEQEALLQQQMPPKKSTVIDLNYKMRLRSHAVKILKVEDLEMKEDGDFEDNLECFDDYYSD